VISPSVPFPSPAARCLCARADWGAASQAGERVWEAVTSGAAWQAPSLLTPALLLLHADLKRYAFAHCVAFPALKTPAPYALLACAPRCNALPEATAAALCTLLSGESRG